MLGTPALLASQAQECQVQRALDPALPYLLHLLYLMHLLYLTHLTQGWVQYPVRLWTVP